MARKATIIMTAALLSAAVAGAPAVGLAAARGQTGAAGPAAPSAASLAAAPPTERLVDVGTHRLQVRVEGTGFPTVVIDAGLGDGSDKLRPLQARLAKSTRVVTYDRAGYEPSEAGPLPRDAAREAQELRLLLEKAEVPGPYVIVGHSLGALNAQLFAARFPTDVAGLVLLDPPPQAFIAGQEFRELAAMAERMTAEWQANADRGAGAANPAGRAQAAFFRTLASEHREMFGASARQVAAIATFGDVPLVVVASGKANPAFGESAARFQAFWIEQSRALAGKSSRGKFALAPESSHYLYVDAPELVAQTVVEVLQEAHHLRAKPGTADARR